MLLVPQYPHGLLVWLSHTPIFFHVLRAGPDISRVTFGPIYEEAITWILFSHYCPFVTGIHRSPVDFSHKGTVMQSCDVFVEDQVDVLLSKQYVCRWFETHCCLYDLTVLCVSPGFCSSPRWYIQLWIMKRTMFYDKTCYRWMKQRISLDIAALQ